MWRRRANQNIPSSQLKSYSQMVDIDLQQNGDRDQHGVVVVVAGEFVGCLVGRGGASVSIPTDLNEMCVEHFFSTVVGSAEPAVCQQRGIK
jgi:hypothetical protein